MEPVELTSGIEFVKLAPPEIEFVKLAPPEIEFVKLAPPIEFVVPDCAIGVRELGSRCLRGDGMTMLLNINIGGSGFGTLDTVSGR